MLEGGTLAYYLSSTEVSQGCRGSFKVTSCDIHGERDRERELYSLATEFCSSLQWNISIDTHL